MTVSLFVLCALYCTVTIICFDFVIGSSAEERLHDVFFAEQASAYLKSAQQDAPRPPLILIPGLLSSRLISWKIKRCRGPDIMIQDVLWLNLQKMLETTTYDKTCWLDCLKLGVNGSDPSDCKLRPDEGLGAIGELSPGSLYTPPATSIFTQLIKLLASELGYDVNSMLGSPYDWRLAPSELETRDSFFTTFKFRIETAVKRHRRPAVIIAHSMGNSLFLYFVEWLKQVNRPAMGYRRWIRRHVWGYVGFAAPLLGAPMALKGVLSGHNFGLTISEAQARELQLTYSSTHLLNPKASSSNSSDSSGGYEVPLVTIRSSSGGSTVHFSLADVDNGELFRWCAAMYGEPLMHEKYLQLQSRYKNDALLLFPPRRPPVRHVTMVYGVNIGTEVGYIYKLAAEGGPPVLEEVFYEEVTCATGITTTAVSTSLQHCERENYVSAAAMSAPSSTSTAVCRVEDENKEDEEGEAKPKLVHNSQVVDANATLPPPPTKIRPTKTCSVDIVSRSRRVGRTGVHVSKGRTVKPSVQPKTGDITVPYISLSYALNWLDGDGAGSNTSSSSSSSSGTAPGPRRWQEHRPERVHRHVLDNWAPSSVGNKMATVDPAVDLFYSLSEDGDSTTVIEVSGVDHLDIAKDAFVHSLVLESLLPKIGKELRLGEHSTNEDVQPSAVSSAATKGLQLSQRVFGWILSFLPSFGSRRGGYQDVDSELSAFEFVHPSQSRHLEDELLVGGKGNRFVDVEVPGRKRAIARRFLRSLRAMLFSLKRRFDSSLISLIRAQSADGYY